MDTLHEIIIGIISGFIGYKVERYLEDKIKMVMLDIIHYHNHYCHGYPSARYQDFDCRRLMYKTLS